MADIIGIAIKEDVGQGDLTTKLTVPRNAKALARIIAKEPGVISGINQAEEVFLRLDGKIKFIKKAKEGGTVKKGTTIALIRGEAAAILTGERTALNFLQRLSGIATLTREFVNMVNGSRVKILDTRKTTPGLRMLEKAAVKAGGGTNHRIGLYDAVLIKDNHIAIAGGVRKAIERVKGQGARGKGKIEVEAKGLRQVKEALEAGADRILLDNMSPKLLKKCVMEVKAFNRAKKKHVTTEASGGINLGNVRKAALTGVDFISVGALTHSAKALDISLDVL